MLCFHKLNIPNKTLNTRMLNKINKPFYPFLPCNGLKLWFWLSIKIDEYWDIQQFLNDVTVHKIL